MSVTICHQCIQFLESKQGQLTPKEWQELGLPSKSSCQICKITLKHEYAKSQIALHEHKTS